MRLSGANSATIHYSGVPRTVPPIFAYTPLGRRQSSQNLYPPSSDLSGLTALSVFTVTCQVTANEGTKMAIILSPIPPPDPWAQSSQKSIPPRGTVRGTPLYDVRCCEILNGQALSHISVDHSVDHIRRSAKSWSRQITKTSTYVANTYNSFARVFLETRIWRKHSGEPTSNTRFGDTRPTQVSHSHLVQI